MDDQGEKKAYLTRQLITYIGNKRLLLGFIGEGIKRVQSRLCKNKLKMLDMFSGSGIAARYFKRFSELLVVNDLEKYSKIINECYLSNEDELDLVLLKDRYREIIEKSRNPAGGMIAELYAPRNDGDIRPGERVFYTSRNAMYIDTVRKLIEDIPEKQRPFFLAPLLSEASIHANTSGIFKGFHKNRETGVGQFGGSKQDSLFRITGDINLPFPVFSNFNCQTIIRRADANEIAETLPEVDIAYLDPPYNQHPYGSNYFMLNLILDYRYPLNASAVSGIPSNWNRSGYNRENLALKILTELVHGIKAKYVLISFNSEGFIGVTQMQSMLEKIGRLETLETDYTVFRGCRNVRKRCIRTKEYLYLLEK